MRTSLIAQRPPIQVTKEATMSTRKFSRLLLAPLLIVASLAWAPGASAAPLQASGTLTYTSSTIHSVRTVGGCLSVMRPTRASCTLRMVAR